MLYSYPFGGIKLGLVYCIPDHKGSNVRILASPSAGDRKPKSWRKWQTEMFVDYTSIFRKEEFNDCVHK